MKENGSGKQPQKPVLFRAAKKMSLSLLHLSPPLLSKSHGEKWHPYQQHSKVSEVVTLAQDHVPFMDGLAAFSAPGPLAVTLCKREKLFKKNKQTAGGYRATRPAL